MRRSSNKGRLRGKVIWPLASLVMAASLVGYRSDRAEAALRPLRTGVSYVYGNEPIEFEHVKRAGAQLALTPLRWGDVAPRNPPPSWDPENPAEPSYDWEATDLWVMHAVQAGLTPVLQVRGAPAWAQRCPPPHELDSPCKPDPASLAAFARAAALRYSGKFEGLPRVQYWQGLNEPNLSLYFYPQYEGDKAVSPNLYRTLINRFYAAVKSVDPSNLVLAAGLGPIEVPSYTIGPMRFTRQLLCMTGRQRPHPTGGSCGGGVHFDIFDIHPYTTGGPTHKGGIDDVELGDIPKLQALLRAADHAGRIQGKFKRTPLWITELAWDSNPPDPGGLPMSIESQWIAEALYRSWSAGVDNFFWFSLVDFEPEPGVPPNQTLESGLYFWAPKIADQRPKEVLHAFRFPFVALHRRHGLFFWGRTPTATGGEVAIQIEKGGEWRDAVVAHADSHGMFSGLLPIQYGRDKRGAVQADYFGEASLPFPMRRVGDFPHPPFG